MINVLARIDKVKWKKIIRVVAAVLLVIVIYGTYSHFNNRRLQTAADKSYAAGCSDASIKALQAARSSAARNSDEKAKRAEQIGNCYALMNKIDETEKWFRLAEADYRNSKNTSRADQAKQIADNYKLQLSLPEIKNPDNLTEEQKKQGIGMD